jgi:uncharacterized protein YndB with AHSA1/START domain
MTERSVTHATFTLDRDIRTTPQKAFAAFADKNEKAKWFGDPANYTPEIWEFDFREGGREIEEGEFHGARSRFDALYHDIVPNERIVLSYTMYFGGEKLSASLQTTEFTATDTGVHLRLTEYGAYFDGIEDPALRREGTAGLLDALAAVLESGG